MHFAQLSKKMRLKHQKYKINGNSCFECSYNQLIIDVNRCNSTDMVEFYFDKTKRMTEFSAKSGYDGKGKVCYQCDKECLFIQDDLQNLTPSGEQDTGFI